MSKKKVYWGIIIVLIVVALIALFSGKVASEKEPVVEDTTPVAQTGIPSNMSISDEIGG